MEECYEELYKNEIKGIENSNNTFILKCYNKKQSRSRHFIGRMWAYHNTQYDCFVCGLTDMNT